ncbi:hypothetical protein AAHB50_15105 [Bacillus toyonensis]
MGTQKSTMKFGDYMKQELLDSYAVVQMQEMYGLTINDRSQYSLALKNIKVNHPYYSQIKRLNYTTVKKIDEIYSREDVYSLNKKI